MRFSKKPFEQSKRDNLVVCKFKLHTLTFMLFIFPFLLLSQTDDLACGFNHELDPSFTPASPFSHSIAPAVLYAKDPKVFRVKFWQINRYSHDVAAVEADIAAACWLLIIKSIIIDVTIAISG